MGLDAYFELHGADGSEKKSLWRKEQVGLLWLACFRMSDVVFHEEYGGIAKFRCEIGKARRQFEEGLALLRVTFPETDFELGEQSRPHPYGAVTIRGVVGFREFLEGLEEGHVEMPLCYWVDFTGGYIDRFFMNAIEGFTNPDIRVSYYKHDVGQGLNVRAGMPVPGVMTWADFLRALTMFQVGIVLRAPGEDGQVHAPRCLFTVDEFEREWWALAGYG